jgi:hypothetical protein
MSVNKQGEHATEKEGEQVINMYENRIRESNRFVLPVLQENVMAVYIL